MVRLNNCCFCISLRPGCLTLGYCHLVGLIFLLIASIFWIYLGVNKTNSPNPKIVQEGYVIICVCALFTFVYLVAFAFNIVLLVGLHARKPRLVRAFFIFGVVFQIFIGILLLVRIIWLTGVVENFISIAFGIYFLIVIKSYYIQMEEEAAVQNQKRLSV